MRFATEHRFPASPPAVLDVLLDPSFHTHLVLPDLATPEVIAHGNEGDERYLDLRYEFVGRLDPIAQRILAGRRLTWVQRLRIDARTGRGRLDVAAEADPQRLSGTASVALDAVSASETRRVIEGELRVRVPLLGGTAERRIVPGLVRRLDVEAASVSEILAGR